MANLLSTVCVNGDVRHLQLYSGATHKPIIFMHAKYTPIYNIFLATQPNPACLD